MRILRRKVSKGSGNLSARQPVQQQQELPSHRRRDSSSLQAKVSSPNKNNLCHCRPLGRQPREADACGETALKAVSQLRQTRTSLQVMTALIYRLRAKSKQCKSKSVSLLPPGRRECLPSKHPFSYPQLRHQNHACITDGYNEV